LIIDSELVPWGKGEKDTEIYGNWKEIEILSLLAVKAIKYFEKNIKVIVMAYLLNKGPTS